jgi:pimeloyl-ACP methyl ester carboxylesterase
MPNPHSLSRPAESWAEVRAHDRVIRYQRTGSGRPVVILRGADAAADLWPELDNGIAERFRVLRPEVPPAGSGATVWLGDFLDGLGTARLAIIAAQSFAVSAIELALIDPERITRLVLVGDGDTNDQALDGTLSSAAPGSPVPILVLRRGLPGASAVPLIIRFLAP